MTRNRYGNSRSSLGNDILVLVLSFFTILAVVMQYISVIFVPWLKNHPVDAIIDIAIFLVLAYVVWKLTKSGLGYVGNGVGNGIIQIIREVKGTSVTATKKNNELPKIFEADSQDIEDSIATLIKFGWKKQDATMAVHKTVLNNPLSEVDSVSKIVKKVFAEVKI